MELNVDNVEVDDDEDVDNADVTHSSLREPPLSVEPLPLSGECPRLARRQYWPGTMTSGGSKTGTMDSLYTVYILHTMNQGKIRSKQ